MSLCYDYTARKWLDGIEGSRLRLVQLREMVPILKQNQEDFVTDLMARRKQAGAPEKFAVTPMSPFADAIYSTEKAIREQEAVLFRESGPSAQHYAWNAVIDHQVEYHRVVHRLVPVGVFSAIYAAAVDRANSLPDGAEKVLLLSNLEASKYTDHHG